MTDRAERPEEAPARPFRPLQRNEEYRPESDGEPASRNALKSEELILKSKTTFLKLYFFFHSSIQKKIIFVRLKL
jgi:hypothetical protein